MNLSADLLRRIPLERSYRSLEHFFENAWPHIDPAPYDSGRHIGAIAEHLEAVTAGQIRKLIINIPPRCMKSSTVSVMWPAWEWLRAPQNKFLTASYADELAVRDAVKSRDLMRTKFYQDILAEKFPNPSERWTFKGDQNVKSRYENSAGGHRIATSVGGTATGDGGDRILIDDPLSAKQALSEQHRENVKTWYSGTITTRQNDRRTAAIIVIMQRLHEDDLTGYLLSEQLGFEHLFLPMEFQPKVYLGGKEIDCASYGTSIGFRDWRNEPGELLWPQRLTPEIVTEIKRDLGPYGYSGQAQQNPSPSEGGLMKREYWKFYTSKPTDSREIQSWDLTFKDSDGSDYVAGLVWGFKDGNSYLLDGVCDRMNYPTTKAEMRVVRGANPRARTTLVEDKANGPAIIAELGREFPGGIIAIEPQGSKLARVHAFLPALAAGTVYLPDPIKFPKLAPLVKWLIEQAAVFPNGSYDDLVDATTQAHIWAWENGQKQFVTAADLRAKAAGL